MREASNVAPAKLWSDSRDVTDRPDSGDGQRRPVQRHLSDAAIGKMTLDRELSRSSRMTHAAGT